MQLNLAVPSPLQYFSSLVQSDAHFPLLEAAISLAQDEYPDLDVQQVLGDVDQLLARVKRRLPADSPDLQRLRALNQFFFRDLSFGGNVNDYYDPDNSYMNAVLRTRRGSRITLAVLWLELAERLEPFRQRSGVVDEFEVPMGLYLQSAPPREIISRMLRNLKDIHRTQEDWQRLISVQDRLIVLQPEAWPEYRDRGLALAMQGEVVRAVADLETYLEHVEDALDIDVMAERLAELRRAND